MNFDSTTIHSIGISRFNRILGELEVLPVAKVEYDNISEAIVEHVTSDFHVDRISYAFEEDANNINIKRAIKSYFSEEMPMTQLASDFSNSLARCSSHHLIKKGDLVVVHLKDILLYDELVDGLIIAKVNANSSFLQIDHSSEVSVMNIVKGALLGKLDKACLIINTDIDEGYQIYLSTAAGKIEAKYWKDEFLGISPKEASYAPTEQYLDLAKSFIKQHVYEEESTNQVEKHGVLFDAGEFFKNREQYDNQSWEKEVLGEKPERIEAWEQHKEEYSRNKGTALPESFGISNLAVKQNARYFKSVLKLDKNFHVYIHGDRSKIEHGVDPDGKKFYKLYYEEEK